jgi:hypothetical protein
MKVLSPRRVGMTRLESLTPLQVLTLSSAGVKSKDTDSQKVEDRISFKIESNSVDN